MYPAIFVTWRLFLNNDLCIDVLTCLLTYLLTPWSRVLEKLTDSQLVKKFPTFYGTRRFITAFTSARHLCLSSARSIQSMPPYPISWISILILSSYLRLDLPSGLFPSGFPTNTLYIYIYVYIHTHIYIYIYVYRIYSHYFFWQLFTSHLRLGIPGVGKPVLFGSDSKCTGNCAWKIWMII